MSYMYTPHAFNLTFLKNHLEFWTEIWDGHLATFWKLRHLSRNDPIASPNIFVIKN